jgi:endonuclease YncB( thermonuclease family)
MQSLYLKRASLVGALFFLALPAQAANHCEPQQKLHWQQVEYVHDGDSLRLADRRKIRLIGVNTPELARDGRADEPLARAARDFVKKQIDRARGRVGLIYDDSRKDHYGRTLAHIFLPDQVNLTEQLLSNGLGSHIAISPNLDFNDCYAKAQQAARAKKRNLWEPARQRIKDLNNLKTLPGGFQHVKGTVTRIGEGPKNLWLNFGKKLAIRIAKDDLIYFSQWHPATLLKKTIETSGWAYTAKTQKRLRVYHPSVIHVLK